ncbi:MAG: phenylalanine--tRNA ligase subunit beta [Bacillota bacterium]
MLVPFSWLTEYVKTDLSPADLAEKLTMAGIAVEGVHDLAAPLCGVVVGRILWLEPHPSVDRWQIAVTDWGQGPRNLVTAARNIKPGDLVPVAPVGTTLPGGQTIAAVEFEGVVSEGMLCSGAELGLEKHSEGILILAGDWPPGTPAARALGLEEMVLELELTPNRADCLGIFGVAREVAALTGAELRPPATALPVTGPEEVSSLVAVEVEAPDLAPRYCGKVFLDLKIGPSPVWMQRRLRAAGLRPINNVVDITNYVMLELNQPLHAFDLDRVAERRFIVRRARPGETLRTLDGVERELPAEALLIADPAGPLGLAGIMGGASSEVTEATKAVFLEGAFFERTGIRRTAKAMGMRTEASFRFERGVDPLGVPRALERAAYLLVAMGAGRVATGTVDVAATVWGKKEIRTSGKRINALLGTDLPTEAIAGYLSRLGMGTAVTADGTLTVEVPSFRGDIEGPADLAEEVARLHGYDRLPSTYPPSSQLGRRTAAQDFVYRTRRLLRGLGQTEVVTYSFASDRLFDRLGFAADDPARQAIRILAPLSEDWECMRTTLLGGILEVLATNARRGVMEAAVFEVARVYLPVPGQELPREPLRLAGGLMGNAAPRFWAERPRPFDFYDLKGLLQALFEGLGVEGATFVPATHPTFHPGRCAAVTAPSGAVLGHLGELHPRVYAAFDLRPPVLLYELDLEGLAGLVRPLRQAASPPRFPAVARDLALLVPEDLSLPLLEEAIRSLGGPTLVSVELFDVYTGQQIQAGKKSMAFSLVFRSEERTLTDEEVNEAMERIVRGLGERYGVTLR